jgi:hypothetical protein
VLRLRTASLRGHPPEPLEAEDLTMVSGKNVPEADLETWAEALADAVLHRPSA